MGRRIKYQRVMNPSSTNIRLHDPLHNPIGKCYHYETSSSTYQSIEMAQFWSPNHYDCICLYVLLIYWRKQSNISTIDMLSVGWLAHYWSLLLSYTSFVHLEFVLGKGSIISNIKSKWSFITKHQIEVQEIPFSFNII